MKKLLWLVLIVVMVVSLLPQIAYAEVTIEALPLNYHFAGVYLNHSFTLASDDDVRFVFYGGGTLYYESSIDGGLTWGNKTSLDSIRNQSRYFDLWYDAEDNKVHIVKTIGPDIYYVRGTPYGNGSIILDTAWQLAVNIGGPTYTSYPMPSVTVDSANYPVIAYSRFVNPFDAVYCTRSSTNDGTWITEWDTSLTGWYNPYKIQHEVRVVGLESSRRLAVFWKWQNSAPLNCIRYTGIGWGSTITTTSSLRTTVGEYASTFDATPQGDTVHIAFLEETSYDIIYTLWDYSTHSFSAETTLYSGATSTSCPSIQRFSTNNDLVVYYQNDPVDDTVYLAYYPSAKATWYTEIEWFTEIDDLPEGYFLNSDAVTTRSAAGLYFVTSANGLNWQSLNDQFDVDTLAPTSITDTQATLKGEIVSIAWGNPMERGFYLNTSESLVGAAKYSQATGPYGVGIFSITVGGLAPETTYYYIAYADNAETAWGTWVSFTTLAGGVVPTPAPGGNCTIAPVITTTAATYISMTSARLNALVNDAGCWDCTCSVYFQWYKAGGAWGDNQNFPVSGYHTGDTPYLNIASLDGNSTYYFRAMASNNCGNTTGNTRSFTTLVALENVTDFLAIPRANEPTIDLTWQKPVGATEVLIRYKLGEYPGNSTDGIFVCQESTTNGFAHEELTAGDTLYYSAWGVSGNYTSTTAAHAVATVSLATSPTAPTAPDMPSNWFTGVQYTNMSSMPFYGVINTVSDAFGFNRQFFWGSLGFLIALLVFIAAYRATQARVMVALIAATVVMGIETKMGLMAGFMIFVLLLLSMSAWAVERR